MLFLDTDLSRFFDFHPFLDHHIRDSDHNGLVLLKYIVGFRKINLQQDLPHNEPNETGLGVIVVLRFSNVREKLVRNPQFPTRNQLCFGVT